MTGDTGLNKPEISVQFDLWEDPETTSIENMTSWPSKYRAELADPATIRKLNEMGTRATPEIRPKYDVILKLSTPKFVNI
jgi:hypothetical protein